MLLQRLLLNRVITAPVLVTLTLTFGLDLILNNAMIYWRSRPTTGKIDPLNPPTGSISIFDVVVPGDRVTATGLGAGADLSALSAAAYARESAAPSSRCGMDRDAAVLMGVDVKSIYAITFGLGALMAGCRRRAARR